MIELLRDPLWQFVGAVLTLLAVGATVVIYFLRRRKKRLTYDVVSSSSLLSMKDELEGNLEIKYGGHEVDNVHLINIKIYNSGNVPLKRDDFERRLSINFGDGSRVLSSEVTETTPENLEIDSESNAGELRFAPVLLNSKDSFSVKALVSDYEGDLEVDARIVGVSSIRRGPEGQRATLVAMASGMLLTLAGLGLYAYSSEPTKPEPLFENQTQAIGAIALGVGYITMIVAMTRFKKYRNIVHRIIKRGLVPF